MEPPQSLKLSESPKAPTWTTRNCEFEYHPIFIDRIKRIWQYVVEETTKSPTLYDNPPFDEKKGKHKRPCIEPPKQLLTFPKEFNGAICRPDALPDIRLQMSTEAMSYNEEVAPDPTKGYSGRCWKSDCRYVAPKIHRRHSDYYYGLSDPWLMSWLLLAHFKMLETRWRKNERYKKAVVDQDEESLRKILNREYRGTTYGWWSGIIIGLTYCKAEEDYPYQFKGSWNLECRFHWVEPYEIEVKFVEREQPSDFYDYID